VNQKRHPLVLRLITATIKNQIISVDDNYPWSIPGYRDTLTKQSAPLNITQTRGEPDQFIICSDCPCATPKNATEHKPLKKKETARPTSNLKKCDGLSAGYR